MNEEYLRYVMIEKNYGVKLAEEALALIQLSGNCKAINIICSVHYLNVLTYTIRGFFCCCGGFLIMPVEGIPYPLVKSTIIVLVHNAAMDIEL